MDADHPVGAAAAAYLLTLAKRSASLQRQRRWALELWTGYVRAHCGEDFTFADMFGLAPQWLDSLRSPGTDGNAPRLRGTPNTPIGLPAQRACAAAVRAFARHTTTPAPARLRLPRPEELPALTPGDIALYRERLTGHRPAGVTPEGWARYRAVALTLLATGLSIEALATLDADQHLTHGPLTITHPDLQAPVPLHGGTRAAMNSWLTVRAGLHDRLEGTPMPALWVRLAPAHTQPKPLVPPGLPVRPRALAFHHHTVTDALLEEIFLPPADWSLRALRDYTRTHRPSPPAR
ncbi:hypothetical protein AB0I28_31980 [Phytomonospora sp. NPDC050363]|uniref:hypothetical protein n=1 Tax=Phytomonospora sp. NPDC050363 TaxID=3155642 RepID=UPI0034110F1F